MDVSEIEQFFHDFDTDQRGYITFEQFRQFCEDKGLSNVEEIFETMDRNNDGMIERSEFVNSFHSLVMDDTVDDRDTPGIVITCDEEEPHQDDTIDYASHNNNNNSENSKDEDHETGPSDQFLEKPSRVRRRASTPRSGALRSQSWHTPRNNKFRKSSSDVAFGRSVEERIYTSNQGAWDSFAESLGESIFGLSR